MLLFNIIICDVIVASCAKLRFMRLEVMAPQELFGRDDAGGHTCTAYQPIVAGVVSAHILCVRNNTQGVCARRHAPSTCLMTRTVPSERSPALGELEDAGR
eukprot:15557142-Heterocapsa_arctica.AAC.1